MILKILFFTVFSFVFFTPSFAQSINSVPEKPYIISREEWGVDEAFTNRESSHWIAILKKWDEYVAPYVAPETKKKRELEAKKAVDYINENFAEQNTAIETLEYDPTAGYRLAWPLKYSENENAIVIHHTATEYASSEAGIKNIYRYHSLSNGWGDIGYNYIIGYNGEIYEGRKGGDYVSAAHSKWNNLSTLGIAVMGNYESKPLSTTQYESLEKLVKYLAWKYGIDFSKKYYYNMSCAGKTCNIFPLETKLEYTLTGHRHTGHTSCPGDMLMAQVEEMRRNNISFTANFKPIKKGESSVQKNPEVQNLNTVKIQKVIELIRNKTPQEKEKILENIENYMNKQSVNQAIQKELLIIRLGVNISLKSTK